MKFTWEEEDIVPGRKIVQGTEGKIWVLGWLPHIAEAERHVLVSLADGLVTPPKSKGQMATLLTLGAMIPAEHACHPTTAQ
jgi:hypothetical protein